MNRRKLSLILAAAVLLLCILIPQSANAASSSEIRNQINDLKDQKSELQNQMAQLQDQYEETENEILNIVGQKNIIDQEIGLLYAQIANINDQIAAFNLLIADKQDELDSAQTLLKDLSAKNKERIRAMEEEGNLSYWAVLFKANSFSDLLDRLNMIEEIAASDHRRLQEMSEAATEVEQARVDLEAEKADLDLTKAELDGTYLELEQKRQESDALLQQLLQRGEELEALYGELAAEESELLNQIAQKEQEYNDAKHQEWVEYMATYTTVPPETTAPPTTVPPTTRPPETETGEPTEGKEEDKEEDKGNSEDNGGNSGNTSTVTWLRPCSYILLSSPFGNRDQPTAGASTYHQGVDLAGPAGTPIYATRTGVVTTASYTNAAGYYVSINHGDGYSSIYMHMTNYVVRSGQAVSAGQLIGYMGSTGISTGPHLHFGIAYNGGYVNPALFINF